jgi:hypothetical protein
VEREIIASRAIFVGRVLVRAVELSRFDGLRRSLSMTGRMSEISMASAESKICMTAPDLNPSLKFIRGIDRSQSLIYGHDRIITRTRGKTANRLKGLA